MMPRYRTWGDAFNAARRRGHSQDHARWAADRWWAGQQWRGVWHRPPQHHRKWGRPMMAPLTPEQWEAASAREGLLAQLRGQRGANRLILAELRECRETIERLYGLLRYVWAQTPGATVKGDDDNMIRVYLRIGKVREITALFVEGDE